MEFEGYARKRVEDCSRRFSRRTPSGWRWIAIATALVCSGSVAVWPANAQTYVGPTAITRIRTGWNSDQFVIETGNLAIVNPANCPNPNGYMSSMSESGYKTHYAATLMAFGMNKPIEIIVSNTECVANSNPKIMGIYVAP